MSRKPPTRLIRFFAALACVALARLHAAEPPPGQD
jgi:hypothetical protein